MNPKDCIERLRIDNLVPKHIFYGYTCILVDDIPAEVRSRFDKWFEGQTGLITKDNRLAVYAWDWENFLNHLENKTTFWD